MTMVTPTTICTPRRSSARPAEIFRRISSSSRAAVVNPVSTSPSRSPRRVADSINAAITRSADGSSNSAANADSAWSIGTLARNRPTSRTRAGRINIGACTADAGIACSRLACAAMVSRSVSVHVTNASSDAICRCSAPVPPNSAGHHTTNAPNPTAATGHRVTAKVSAATAIPPRIRPDNTGDRRALLSRAVRVGGRVGSTTVPQAPAAINHSAAPRPAPSSTAIHT